MSLISWTIWWHIVFGIFSTYLHWLEMTVAQVLLTLTSYLWRQSQEQCQGAQHCITRLKLSPSECWRSLINSLSPGRSRTMDFLLQFAFTPLPTPAIISLFAVAAATLFYLNTRPNPVRTPVDLNCQTTGVKVRVQSFLFHLKTCTSHSFNTLILLRVLRMEPGKLLSWRITTTWYRRALKMRPRSTRFFRRVWKFQVMKTFFTFSYWWFSQDLSLHPASVTLKMF